VPPCLTVSVVVFVPEADRNDAVHDNEHKGEEEHQGSSAVLLKEETREEDGNEVDEVDAH